MTVARKTKAKASPGRPTKYDERFCRLALDLARLGLTNAQMAKSFGVTTSTFSLWLATHEPFSDAIKEGREVADANVVRALYERACGYSHPAVKIMQYEGDPVTVNYTEHYPPDPVSCIFWLRNRRPESWRNNPSPEDGQEIPAPVKVEVNVVDARKRRAEA